mgnify:CR=1 FL=1
MLRVIQSRPTCSIRIHRNSTRIASGWVHLRNRMIKPNSDKPQDRGIEWSRADIDLELVQNLKPETVAGALKPMHGIEAGTSDGES